MPRFLGRLDAEMTPYRTAAFNEDAAADEAEVKAFATKLERLRKRTRVLIVGFALGMITLLVGLHVFVIGTISTLHARDIQAPCHEVYSFKINERGETTTVSHLCAPDEPLTKSASN